jgi:hypothetical protein
MEGYLPFNVPNAILPQSIAEDRERYAIYVFVSGVLILKLFFVALSTGFVRSRHKVVSTTIFYHLLMKNWQLKVTINAEDARMMKVDVSEREHPAVMRVKK